MDFFFDIRDKDAQLDALVKCFYLNGVGMWIMTSCPLYMAYEMPILTGILPQNIRNINRLLIRPGNQPTKSIDRTNNTVAK